MGEQYFLEGTFIPIGTNVRGEQSCLGMNVRGDNFSRGRSVPPSSSSSYYAILACISDVCKADVYTDRDKPEGHERPTFLWPLGYSYLSRIEKPSLEL